MIPEQVREAAAKIAKEQASLSRSNDYDAGWCRAAMCIEERIRAMPIPPAPVPADVAGLAATKCPICGSRHYATVAELKADGNYGPGPLRRCVECKTVWDTAAAALEAQARQIAAPVTDHPKVRALIEALKPLVAIADAFDANELDDEARKFWGQHSVNTTPHENIELYAGRGGKELLTLADCMAARVALRALEEGK